MKPGAVALVQNEYGVWNVAILQVQPEGLRWVYGVSYASAPTSWPTRPLLVIDPDDTEQVKRFSDTYAKLQGLPEAGPSITAAMAAALREFATPTPPTPPKPDEPTGLGAVVEDDCGDIWVRVNADTHRWQSNRATRYRWSDIDAVRVLSEGVTP